MRLAQSLLALLQRALGQRLLGYIQPMAQYARRRSWLVISYVAVTPDSVRAVFGDQPHQAAVGARRADAFEVVVKLGLNGGGQEFLEVTSEAIFHCVAE